MGYWRDKPFWKFLKFIRIHKLPFSFKEKLMWKLYWLEIKFPLRIFGYNTIEFVDKYSIFIGRMDRTLNPGPRPPMSETGKKLLSATLGAYLKE